MDAKYAPTAWSPKAALYDFKCPSGQLCQLKQVTLPDLLSAGLLEELDTLGMLMQTEVVQPAKGGNRRPQDRQPKKPTKAQAAAAEEQAVRDMIKDPKQFSAMARLMERVVAVVVVQPTILSPWDGERKLSADERDPDAIYSDHVSFQDQMAIFGEAMGDKGMEEIAQFRNKSGDGVESVEDVAVVSLPAE